MKILPHDIRPSRILVRLAVSASLALTTPWWAATARAQPGPPKTPHTIAALTVAGDTNCADLRPSLTALRGGGVFAVWERSGCGGEAEIYGRRYDALGRTSGPAFRIVRGSQPAIGELIDGTFALAYFDDPGQNQFGIFLVRLDETGRAQGAPLEVSEPANDVGVSDSPRIAVSPFGEVALSWNVQVSGFSPFLRLESDLHRPAVRFFNSALQPTTAALRATEMISKGSSQPDVGFSNTGVALVVWSGPIEAGNSEVIAGRRYDPQESWLDAEPVNLTQNPVSELRSPRLAPQRGGGWWLAWLLKGSIFPVPREGFVGAVAAGSTLASVTSVTSLGLYDENISAPALGTDLAGNLIALITANSGKIQGVSVRPSGIATPIFALDSAGFAARDLAIARGSANQFVAWSSASSNNPLNENRFDVLGRILRTACDPNVDAACFDGLLLSPSVTVERAGVGGALQALHPMLIGPNTALYFRPNQLVPDVAVQLGQNAAGEFELTYAAMTSSALRIRQYGASGPLRREVNKAAGRFKSARVGGVVPGISAASETADLFQGFEIDVPSASTGFDDSLAEAATEACGPTPTRLCLFAGRFRIEATYVDAGGATRAARVAPHGDRTGSLEFDGRPAMIVSVVDGTSSNGKIWLYLGGLSTAQSTVTVTEVATGRKRLYGNTAGKLESRVDRQAF